MARSRPARVYASSMGAWVVLLSLIFAIGTRATPAEAAPITANLPTMSITLNDLDPTHNTLAYVHGDKDRVVPSLVGIEDGAGTYNLAASAAEFKGRGNYTWGLPKKPYQIKFNSWTAILGMPKAKAWVLLANDADGSLMRNKLAFDYALAIGSPYAPESRWVDLVVNGQYMGNYLVAEKVEVKTSRVELTDPQGVLGELDNNYGYAEDYNFISTVSKTTFTLKDAKGNIPAKAVGPLPADVQIGWDDLKATLNRLDGLLAAANPDWATISSIIDLDSFVKFYFVYELTENPEIVASSIFFYKNGVSSKLYAGPVWDFDSSLGTYDHTESLGAMTNAEYVKNADLLRLRGNGWYRQLFRNPAFVTAANTLWQTGGAGYAATQLPTKIAQYKTQIEASAANNFAKWKVLGTPTHLVAGEGRPYSSTYAGEVSYLSTWVTARVNHTCVRPTVTSLCCGTAATRPRWAGCRPSTSGKLAELSTRHSPLSPSAISSRTRRSPARWSPMPTWPASAGWAGVGPPWEPRAVACQWRRCS